MMVTKKHISRRTVLRGMGSAVTLPFLESMVPAFASTTGRAPRLACIGVHGRQHGSLAGDFGDKQAVVPHPRPHLILSRVQGEIDRNAQSRSIVARDPGPICEE